MPPWDRYASATAAPVAAPVQAAPVVAAPINSGIDPAVILREEAAARAREDQQIQRDNNTRTQATEAERLRIAQEVEARSQASFEGTGGTATEGQAKTSTMLARILGGMRDIGGRLEQSPDAQSPGLAETMSRGMLGEGMVTRAISGEDRRIVSDAQRDMVDALLTLSTGAAYTPEQVVAQQVAYFPQYGDSQEEIGVKNQRLQRLIEAARVAAGPQWGEIEAAITPLMPAVAGSTQAAAEQAAPPVLGGGAIALAGGTQPPAGIPPTGDGRILGNTHDNGFDMETAGIETGRQNRSDNPALAGVQSEYLARLERGDTAQSILRWAREAGVDPSAYTSIQEQVQFRRENPNVPMSEYGVTQLDDQFVNVDPLARGLGNTAMTPLGTYAVSAGDAATGFNLDSMVGMAGGNAEQARGAIDEVSRMNPTSSFTGMMTGGALTALTAEAGLARAGLTAAVPRMLAADGAYGALAGAGSSDYASDGSQATAGDRLRGAGIGALAGVAGSYAGGRVGNALGGVARGVADASVGTLRREGVNALTVGQTFGGSGRVGAAVRGVEDRLSGLPVVGDMVNARRADGFRQINTKAFDKALEPIGGNVSGKVGQDAVADAQEQVGQAFTDALSGVGVQADEAFEKDLGGAVQMMTQRLDRSHPGLVEDIGEIFMPFADEPVLSGEALQIISRELRDVKLAYRQDPRFKVIGNSIDRVERAVFDLYDRQASGVVPAYNKARQAYRRLATLEDAVMKAQNQPDQMFTPAQLNRADTASGRRLEGRRAAARGDTPFNELAVAGQAVLPNKIPDSGTAGRLLVPLALVGGGGGVDATGATSGAGLTIGAILAGLYTRTGQRVFTKAGRGMAEGSKARAVLESPRTKRAIAIGGAATGGAVATNQR